MAKVTRRFEQTTDFWKEVEDCLVKSEHSTTRDDRLRKFVELLDFALEYQKLFTNPDGRASRLCDIIKGRLLNFKTNAPTLLDCDKYLVSLFPKNDIDQPVPTQVVSQPIVTVTETVVKMVFPNLVFEDYKEAKFVSVQHMADTLLEQILLSVSDKYPESNPETITSLLTKTQDQIKEDKTYPSGPFLVKVNENFYELYEKVTEEKVNTGYLYNSKPYEVPSVNKVGRYGQVF